MRRRPDWLTVVVASLNVMGAVGAFGAAVYWVPVNVAGAAVMVAIGIVLGVCAVYLFATVVADARRRP